MLDAEPYVGVVVERLVSGFVDVRGLQRDGFVTVFFGHFDPAIPVAVLYICSAEDDEAGFELLNIDEEGHDGGFFLCGICVYLIRNSLICFICAGVVYNIRRE